MVKNKTALLRGERASGISKFLFIAMLYIKEARGENIMPFKDFCDNFRRWLTVIHRKNNYFCFRIGNGRGLKDTLESLATQNLVEIFYTGPEPVNREFPFHRLAPCGEGHFMLHRTDIEEILGVSFDEIEKEAKKLRDTE